MKKILVLFLVFVTGMVLAENTIIAIVNNAPISLHSLKDNFLSSKTVEEKIEILNAQIDITLQLQKVSEFNLRLTYEDVCLLYTSPSPRDRTRSRMPSSA